jgi:hypothetical protein
MLASRIRILDRWIRLPSLDDDHGEPGQLEPVPRLSTPQTTRNLFLLRFILRHI